MKTILKQIKKINLNKIIAFIIIEIMIMTIAPIPMNARGGQRHGKDNRRGIVKTIKNYVYGILNSGKHRHDRLPLVLSYTINRDNNLLMMSWNREEGLKEKYYDKLST